MFSRNYALAVRCDHTRLMRSSCADSTRCGALPSIRRDERRLQRVRKLATFMNDRQDFDGFVCGSIEHAIRRNDQLADRNVVDLRHRLSDLWLYARQWQPLIDSGDYPSA